MERQQREEQEALQRELDRRSEVLKRGLPRPLGAALLKGTLRAKVTDASLTFSDHEGPEKVSRELLLEASRAVNEEMLSLILRDEYKFPHESGVGRKGVARVQPVELDELPDEYISRAKEAVAKDLEALRSGPEGEEFRYLQDHFAEIWEEAYKGMAFLPNEGSEGGGGAFVAVNSKADVLLALKTQHGALKAHADRLVKKATKLQNKLQVTTQVT